jgi:uncharacterized membrane protein
MTYNTFKIGRISLAALIAIAAAVAIVLGIVYILLAALVAGMAALVVLRRRVVEVVEDERTYAVAYRAARLTVVIVGVGTAVAGAILLALARQDFTSTLAQVGFALEYVTCALLVINYIAYYYYSRKLGGS